jgi:Fe-S-cluster-containing dehydrogenase component
MNRCVGCGACRAACILENGWEVSPRMIYTYNTEAISTHPLLNLSLACNHCEKPVCLEGCPSGSYYRDSKTGAIVIDEKKCIGCKYCKWNCPYDAPKFDDRKKVIGKCNLCYTGLNAGRSPACSSACPTGALSYGDIIEPSAENIPSWFPEKNLNPAIEFTGIPVSLPLTIIPERKYDSEIPAIKYEKKLRSGLISLLVFTFLSTVSVGLIISSGIKGVFPDAVIFIPLIIVTAISSLFHLGKVLRAWRAVLNIKSSPLSLEIVLFVLYSVLSVTAVFFQLPSLLIISSITGLLFMLSVDNVYNYAEKPKSPVLQSGQTFISSLLIISFLSESLIPFVFIAAIKTGLSVYRIFKTGAADSFSVLRTIRIAFLIISGAAFLYYKSLNTTIIAIFLIGELIDRIVFYIDFEQLNIKTLIIKHLTTSIK